jgi:hypothetical protein
MSRGISLDMINAYHCSEFLLKKLFACRIVRSNENAPQYESEAFELAEKLIKDMSDIEKMSFGPEATICVIAENYGMLMREEGEHYAIKPMKNEMFLNTIVKELDKHRPNKIAIQYANSNDGFFAIAGYISKTIELENYNVFVNYDRDMLHRQIDIAIRFQFNSEDRIDAIKFETARK